MKKLLEVETLIKQYFGVTPEAQSQKAYSTLKHIPGVKYHEGIDFVPIDREHWGLFAPVGGKIMHAGWGHPDGTTGDYYGWNVILYDERSGLSFRWCHLEDAIMVKEGESVKEGDLLGVGGDSGNSTARHFHMNCVPMLMRAPGVYEYGVKAFPGNGFRGRTCPIAALRKLGVWI